MKTCCITGHRKIKDSQIDHIKESLYNEIQMAIEDGYTCFMTGFAEGVDQYFADSVIEFKKEYTNLKLIAVIPYRNRLNSLAKKEHTKAILDACSDMIVIGEEYEPDVYYRRNHYMIENSDRIIAVYDGRGNGGTFMTIQFAHSLKKELRKILVK